MTLLKPTLPSVLGLKKRCYFLLPPSCLRSNCPRWASWPRYSLELVTCSLWLNKHTIYICHISTKWVVLWYSRLFFCFFLTAPVHQSWTFSTGLSAPLTFPVSTDNTLLHGAVVVPGADFRCICSTVSFHRKDAGQLDNKNLCYSAKPNDCWLLCRNPQCGRLNFLWKV